MSIAYNTRQPVAEQPAIVLTRPFMLRVGGMSVESVKKLRFAETLRRLDAVYDVERLQQSLSSRLIPLLDAAVARAERERKTRSKLINAKRSVLKHKAVRSADVIRPKLTPNEWSCVVEWNTLLDRHARQSEQIEATFAEEEACQRRYLKTLLGSADFRNGLMLSSLELSKNLESYLDYERPQLNKRVRQYERSLLSYLLRTAYKTSPFSTFTPIALGAFSAEPATQPVEYHINDFAKRSYTQFNVAILSRLAALIAASKEFRSQLPLEMVAEWRVERDRVRYLRKRQVSADSDEAGPVELNMLHESVFYLPNSRLLQAIIDLLAVRRVVRFECIVDEVKKLSDAQIGRRDIEGYIDHLVRLGFLYAPALQTDIHSSEPLTTFRQNLSRLKIEALQPVILNLLAVEADVAAYPHLSTEERETTLVNMRRKLTDCFEQLGGTSKNVPRTVLYEDTAVADASWRVSEQGWGSIIEDVKEWQQLLPLFDVNQPKRLALKGFFQARYGQGGRCDDFLTFANEFYRDFFENFMQASTEMPLGTEEGAPQFGPRHRNFFNQCAIDQLNEGTQLIDQLMQDAFDKRSTAETAVVLDDRFLEQVRPYVPEDIIPLHSNTYFSQFAELEGEPTLIINRIYTGGTLMFSRFASFLHDGDAPLAEILRVAMESFRPKGAVFAELKGGHDATNLNLHPRVTPYEIVCPGEVTSAPAAEQIPLADLYIVDDPETNRLRLCSRRLNCEVIPLYLGFLLPMSLPEVQQVLLQFSPASMCPLNLWRSIKARKQSGDIISYPRLCYKRLVLERAHHLIRGGFPQRQSGQTDLDYFLDVNRWYRRNRLPACGFVVPDTSGADEEERTVSRTRHKPLFVDFRNLFSVLLLESTLRPSSGRFVLTEMLPAHDELWLEHDGQHYVAEFVFEVTDVNNKADRDRLA